MGGKGCETTKVLVGNSWNLDDYRELVTQLCTAYELVDVPELAEQQNDEKPKLWLRHDVEVDEAAAKAMADAEAELGVSGTYLLCAESGFFDIGKTKKLARRLLEQDHQVGLHLLCDPTSTRQSLCDKRTMYAAKLAIDSDCPVSLHFPAERDATKLAELCPTPEVYASYANGNWDYKSDSTGRWRYGSPLALDGSRPVQLLTHPIWWGGSRHLPSHAVASFLPQFSVLEAEPALSQALDL